MSRVVEHHARSGNKSFSRGRGLDGGPSRRL